MLATPVRTEHPHIVRTAGVAGGRPSIAGTRISVELVARFLRAGVEPWEIVATYPHLTPAAVYDAVSYYLDHQAEIDQEIAESTLDALSQRMGFTIDQRGKVLFRAR